MSIDLGKVHVRPHYGEPPGPWTPANDPSVSWWLRDKIAAEPDAKTGGSIYLPDKGNWDWKVVGT